MKPLRIAVAASFTAGPLGNYLEVEGARRGFHLQPWFAPYGQFELQCSTPESALFAGRIVSEGWVAEMVRPRSEMPSEERRYGLGAV